MYLAYLQMTSEETLKKKSIALYPPLPVIVAYFQARKVHILIQHIFRYLL